MVDSYGLGDGEAPGTIAKTDPSDMTEDQVKAWAKGLYGRDRGKEFRGQSNDKVDIERFYDTNIRNFDDWSKGKKGDFDTLLSGYSKYLDEDRFKLTDLMKKYARPTSFKSNYLDKSFRTAKDMKDADLSAYKDATSSIKGFDDWLEGQSDKVKGDDYGAQHSQYKSYADPLLADRPSWLAVNSEDSKSFKDFDPGLFVAGDEYEEFAGSYRNQGEVDGKFRTHYADQIMGLGYGDLLTDDLGIGDYGGLLTEATRRRDFTDKITDLGYGDRVVGGMDSYALQALYNRLSAVPTDPVTVDPEPPVSRPDPFVPPPVTDPTPPVVIDPIIDPIPTIDPPGPPVTDPGTVDPFLPSPDPGTVDPFLPSPPTPDPAPNPYSYLTDQEDIFQPTPTMEFTPYTPYQYNALNPEAFGTTDYTDIFAPPELDYQPVDLNLGAGFNPYINEINKQYGGGNS